MRTGVGMALSALAVGGGFVVLALHHPLWLLLPLLGVGLIGLAMVGK